MQELEQLHRRALAHRRKRLDDPDLRAAHAASAGNSVTVPVWKQLRCHALSHRRERLADPDLRTAHATSAGSPVTALDWESLCCNALAHRRERLGDPDLQAVHAAQVHTCSLLWRSSVIVLPLRPCRIKNVRLLLAPPVALLSTSLPQNPLRYLLHGDAHWP